MINTVNRSRDESIGDPAVGLYLHIPFCAKRCHFCAFYLVMQEEKRIERFLQALDCEIAFYAAQLGRVGQRVSTVYVGGGTPTVLSTVQLSRVLARVSEEFYLTDACEVTVEATPESLTSEYVDTLLVAGVTRLKAWTTQHKNFSYVLTLSKPSAAWEGKRGRVTDLLQDLSTVNHLAVYVCGNRAMVKEVSAWLEEKGECAIYRERHSETL